MNSVMELFYCSFLAQGGSGYTRNITFERIIMHDLITPIVIDQSYGTLEVILI
jgi:polygalacturonase